MSRGHVQQRGKNSWRLKFDAGRDATGKRKIQYVTFRGNKRDAQVKLAELIAAVGRDTYVEPNKISVAEFVRGRVDQWEASGDISARTAQRYRQLVENQIVPQLGDKAMQKLKPLDVEAWHSTLRAKGRVRGKGGLAPRTIGHAHRVLSKALSEAAKNDLIAKNVCKAQTAPKVPDTEMVIAHDIPALLKAIESHRLYPKAILALFGGLRIGEVLAVRDNTLDLDAKTVEVKEALEQTKAHGIRFKTPKSKAGRRKVTLPDIAVQVLREHRKALLEQRMQLGLGRLAPDALLFSDLDGNPLSPNAESAAWGDLAEAIGMPDLTFHGLRHTHVSQLIDQGVDIVTISKRIGHAKPDITLRIYAHLFRKDDSKAAAAINAVFGSN